MIFDSKSTLLNLNSFVFLFFISYFFLTARDGSYLILNSTVFLQIFEKIWRFIAAFTPVAPAPYYSTLIFSWYNFLSSPLQWIYLKHILESNIFNFVSKAEDLVLLERAAYLKHFSYFLTSFIRYSHILYSSVIFSFLRYAINLHTLMYAFSQKELFCFHKPSSLVPSDLLERGNVNSEWSVEKAVKISGFFTDFWKTLDMKK